MFEGLKKIVKDCMTEGDGVSFCSVRISFCIGILSSLAYAGYSVYLSHVFSMVDFGTGFGALLGSGGAAIGIKSKLGGDTPMPIKGE